MARLIPSDLARLQLSGFDDPELETLSFLAQELPNDFSVFHSLHWTQSSARQTKFGEIDFVVLNREGRVLVIEQKNGRLKETNEGLVKVYGDFEKSLDSQIQRNIGGIRTKYAKQNDGDGLLIDYLIYCPDYRVRELNAAGIDRNRLVDATTKEQLAKQIAKLLPDKGQAKKEHVKRVRDFFTQSLSVTPDVSTFVTSQERVFTGMVEGLADVIEKLEFSPFHLRVVGTAGAGKSHLTLRLCEKALSRGQKPLLLCFNRPFKDQLMPLAPKGVTVNTYYGFCSEFAESAGFEIDFERMSLEGFWREVQDNIVAADIPSTSQFDFLIVDEAQDFKPEWLEILRLFLTDGAGIVWLEDPLQRLLNTEEVELSDFVTYREMSNFRSPQLVADFIKDSLQVEFDNRNPLPGLGVAVHTYSDPVDQFDIVDERIRNLRKIGFSDEDIAIVSCRSLPSSTFYDIEQVGKTVIRRFTGNYSSDGNQTYTDGTVLFDTIYRFKGLQACAIILVDIDDTIGETDFSKRILYCGMTRATIRLELVVKDTCPWVSTFIEHK